MTADLQDRPEPPAPGSFASEPLDRLLVAMQTAPVDPAAETPADYFARRLVARALNGARGEGLSVHATIGAISRQLVAMAAILPALPTPEELETELAELAEIPETEEPPRG